jgi:MATE family multidrug resistance protein
MSFVLSMPGVNSPAEVQRQDSSTSDEDVDHLSRKSALKEAKLLLQLAIPTVTIQLGSVLPQFLVASYVGRYFGSVYLDGFTLASLTGNLFTLSFLTGIFSASDTLSPQAFGANNEREVGLLAMRGYIGSIIVMLPINLVLVCYMDRIMHSFGIDAEVSHHAWRWYQIYACCLPFYAFYQATWKFLSAQSVLMPCVVTVCLSSFVVLPIALVIWPQVTGYLGTSLAIVTFQVFEALSLVAYLWLWKPYSKATWPGFGAWREALERKKFFAYMVRIIMSYPLHPFD